MRRLTTCRRTKVAMNREEVDHGSQGEEIEIEKESQEGGSEKEKNRCEALRADEKVCCEEEESSAEESSSEEEICAEEVCRKEGSRAEGGHAEDGHASSGGFSRASHGGRSCGDGKPDHLSPVQPAGGRRQSG